MPMIVKQFHVTLAQAGLTVSLYALGVTVGAPLLLKRWDNLLLSLSKGEGDARFSGIRWENLR